MLHRYSHVSNTFRGHKSYITCAAVFDTYVFTGSADATIKKWDLTSTKCMFTYKGHTSKIHKILVTKDLMFSTSNDKTARVWHSKITKTNRSKPLIRSFKVKSLFWSEVAWLLNVIFAFRATVLVCILWFIYLMVWIRIQKMKIPMYPIQNWMNYKKVTIMMICWLLKAMQWLQAQRILQPKYGRCIQANVYT